jgi:hypothetical protein
VRVKRGERLRGLVEQRRGAAGVEPPGGSVVKELAGSRPRRGRGQQPDRASLDYQVGDGKHAGETEVANRGHRAREPLGRRRILDERGIEQQASAEDAGPVDRDIPAPAVGRPQQADQPAACD